MSATDPEPLVGSKVEKGKKEKREYLRVFERASLLYNTMYGFVGLSNDWEREQEKREQERARERNGEMET